MNYQSSHVIHFTARFVSTNSFYRSIHLTHPSRLCNEKNPPDVKWAVIAPTETSSAGSNIVVSVPGVVKIHGIHRGKLGGDPQQVRWRAEGCNSP